MAEENRMGIMPVRKLIITTSVPLIISLLVNNLYNLVDSIFVARVSEDALTGISLATPLQMIMIAMGSGLAVGLNAVISKALGEKNQKEIKDTASAAMLIAVGAYLNSHSGFIWNNLCGRRVYQHSALRLLFYSGSGIRRLFESTEYCSDCGTWHQQRTDPHYCV